MKWKPVWWLLCLVLVLAESSRAAEPPRLIIDAQGHSGSVGDVMFSPDGKQLVSVGEDKTIRFWDVERGELRKTLRGQIGDGPEGKIYCGDLSADGRWLAVGGFFAEGGGVDDDRVGDVRLIDVSSGELRVLLTGHTDVVNAVAFSDDGRWLASGSMDKSVRLWDLEKLGDENGGEAEVISDAKVLTGHGGVIKEVDFAKGSDRLLTASMDGKLRLWDRTTDQRKFVLIATMSKHTEGVLCGAFSRDGNYIVSGANDGQLLLWDGRSGNFLKTIDAAKNGLVAKVEFSPDGKSVIASWFENPTGHAAVYDVASGRKLKTFDKHIIDIQSMAWHPTEDLVATAGGDNNEIFLWSPLESGDAVKHKLAGKGAAVLTVGFVPEHTAKVVFSNGFIEMDGDQVKWPRMQSFDFEHFKLGAPAKESDLGTYLYAVHGFDGHQFEWDTLLRMKVGTLGTIEIDGSNNDSIRNVSFTRDGSRVLLASSHALGSYERRGDKYHKVVDFPGHEGIIWTVVSSEDDSYLLSGSMDQSTRLWDMKTGTLLASLFAAEDGEWVCWTPEGYFAASPDGGKYIGWHFNQGRGKMAEFVSGDQLYDHFYRPDIVQRAVTEKRSSESIVAELGVEFDLAEAMANTPGIEFVEPAGDIDSAQRRLAVKVQAIDQGGGIGDVKLFHEGKRLQPDGPGSFRDGRYEVPFTVSLLVGSNEIRAVAVNPDGVESRPKSVHANFQGTKATAKLYVLAVGLNKYKNPRFELNFCRPDVDAFADSLQRRSGKLFEETVVAKLYDEDATREAITGKMAEFAKLATADDLFVFAFAGHGAMSGDGIGADSEFFIIPYSVTQIYGNDEMLEEKALSGSELRELAAAIPARKQLMVMDACQSGGVVDSFAVRGAAEEKALAQLARSTGMYVLASTRSEQFATETEKLGHGLYTYALLEALEGKGDFNGDRKITVKEVEAWLNERVPELSEEHVGAAQYPNSFARGQDFPIVVLD